MKLIYISKYTILPEFGSPTRQYFLSKALAEIKGNEVMLIGSRSTLGNVPDIHGLYQKRTEDHLQMVTLNGPRINLGFNIKRLKSWFTFEKNLIRFRSSIRRFKPDHILVSSLSILTFLSGVYLKRWLKRPLIIEIRDIYPLTLLEVGGYSKRHPAVMFLSWVEKFGYSNADMIISTLPNAKEHIASVINKPFRFKWLPMGIDTEYFNIARGTNDPDINPDKKFIVGYAGTLGKANALDALFEAAVDLETNSNIQFIFMGDGPMKAEYQRRYGSLSNVKFLAPVKSNELQPYLQQMDLLVNTWLDKPIYRFGISPNKWMDYMLSARPILVAYNGYRCIIEEAGCGKFVAAENKDAIRDGILEFAAMPPEQRKKMGENGRKYLLENHTYKQLAKELYTFIQEN
ncbi:MAG TPA: glycosyltransferase family 4 protein [Flavitalea sp.]|nr:glycosyltransferase family 4 protein [Flavitalea sp.]